jgi:ribokinase
MDTLGYTLDLCANAQVPVMLDPAPAATLPDAVWKQVAWFTPNETEAAFYVGGEANVEDTAKRLHAKGLRGVVLKRGAEGAFVSVAGERAEWVKPFKVDAIDTVGAGDCFNGAFAVALEEGKDPWAAARFANAASAISVTRKGAQASMPMRADVEEFLAAHS